MLLLVLPAAGEPGAGGPGRAVAGGAPPAAPGGGPGAGRRGLRRPGPVVDADPGRARALGPMVGLHLLHHRLRPPFALAGSP